MFESASGFEIPVSLLRTPLRQQLTPAVLSILAEQKVLARRLWDDCRVGFTHRRFGEYLVASKVSPVDADLLLPNLTREGLWRDTIILL